MGIVQAMAGDAEQEVDGQADSALSAGKMDPNWGGQKRTDCELWYELITQLCS
jgi:hypothetical protein